MGMTWGANEAGRRLLQRGIARSASVMVPCPWAYDFVRWAVDNPGHDVGIHLTLNAEWGTYRWGPVAGRAQVPTLCDPDGFLWKGHVGTASADDIRAELRAQIETALAWGLKPTHLDNHMWMIHSKPEYFAVFLDLVREYRIAPLLTASAPKPGIELAAELSLPLLADVKGAPGADSCSQMKAKVHDDLRGIGDGTTYYIIHPSLATPDMPSVTPNDWRNREWNFEVFMDADTEAMLAAEGIEVTTWVALAAGSGFNCG